MRSACRSLASRWQGTHGRSASAHGRSLPVCCLQWSCARSQVRAAGQVAEATQVLIEA